MFLLMQMLFPSLILLCNFDYIGGLPIRHTYLQKIASVSQEICTLYTFSSFVRFNSIYVDILCYILRVFYLFYLAINYLAEKI